MPGPRDFKGLSARAKSLLAGSEGLDVDFKREARGLHLEDIVAFANTEAGGTILIGVDESVSEDGRQVGEVVGCPVGDEQRLQIINKALQCLPPVGVQLFIENRADTPFFRLEIPASDQRPHCTPAGCYKIREDGRNRPLLPGEIAQILLDRESESFQARFREATSTLAATLEQVVREVQDIQGGVQSQLAAISNSAEYAGSEASDAAWTLRSLETDVGSLKAATRRNQQNIYGIQQRLAYLLSAHGVEDPVAERAKGAFRQELEEYFQKHPDQLDSWAAAAAVEITSPNTVSLTQQQAEEVLESVTKQLKSRASRRKRKKPSPAADDS